MEGSPTVEPGSVADFGSTLRANIQRAVKVRDEVVRDLLVALLGEGHVLIEDVPGIGKTALARALTRSLDAEYSRIQCTADLLPADVMGTNVFLQREARFEFHPGPVFANVVLVDEINRASPKTQSGLLECMQERRVTIEKQTHTLARPFLVIATQNPVEYEGTYPLPEAQLDRFMVRLSLGYPDRDEEAEMLEQQAGGDRVLELEPVSGTAVVLEAQEAVRQVHASEPLRRYVVAIAAAGVRPVSSADDLARARAEVAQVQVATEVLGYAVDICRATRQSPSLSLGVSPRGATALLATSRAWAWLSGRGYVTPDDIKALAYPTLRHRVQLRAEAELEGVTAESVIDTVLSAVPVPR